MGDGQNAARKKAISLKAADAKELLNSTLPWAFKHMTPAQIQQVQKVLDAAVVNPAATKEYNERMRQSIRSQSGALVHRDPDLVRRAQKFIDTAMIHITDSDKSIRLDVSKLVAPDALKITTDNPDEAAYLLKVKNTLMERGVWLQIGQPFVRDTEDPSRHLIDPRTFQVWLSLGSKGDTIPTKTGLLTREELLGTTVLGAGYYTEVREGGVEKALEKEIKRLISQMDSGVMQHNMLANIRRQAVFGVVGVSDLLGGANFPDLAIWDHPHKLVIKAMELNVGGNVSGSQAYLVVAAVATRNAAQLLAAYIDDSSAGAARAVAVLKVAKAAGEVAEVGLTLTGVPALVRGGVRVVGTGAVKDKAIDIAAEKLVAEYVIKNPGLAADLNKVRWIPGPKGSVGGGIKPGSSGGQGTGWHKW